MHKRHPRGIGGTLALIAAAALSPGSVLAAGPGSGEPDNDSQLSVLTPAQAAFMQLKLDMAASIAPVGSRATTAKGSASRISIAPCEFDPCGDPSAWPPPGGPPQSMTLLTKARQQNNNYFCGPAAGQVVINWTRGIVSGSNNGEDPTTNWKKQSKIAEWMSTTSAGTGGANLATGLNNPSGVRKPVPEWVYSYANSGSLQEFHNKVVTDIAVFGMPLVLATAPHISGAGTFFLESWPNVAPGAHHWIVIRGYDGLWGSPAPTIKYQDSSGGYGGATGAFDDLSSVVWQVNKWNQGGHIVW